MAWLTGWTYRKSITLSRASGAVTNYQMKLLIGESSGASGEDVDCGGHCLSSFNDLRFTASDGETTLDYWIESISGATPNQLATVWIEFDSIGTDATTFYMYYGKSDAAAASNGANTFLLFDDFDDNSIDTDKWEVVLNTWEESSGKLKGTCASNNYTIILSKNQISASDNYAVDATIAAQNGLTALNYQSGLVINDAKVSDSMGIGYWLDLSGYDEWIIKDETGALTEGTKDTNFDARLSNSYSFRKTGTSHKLFVNGVEKASHTYSWSTAPQYVGCYVAYVANYATFNDFRVRQYLATEPAWGAWGSQEDINVTIAPPPLEVTAGLTAKTLIGLPAVLGVTANLAAPGVIVIQSDEYIITYLCYLTPQAGSIYPAITLPMSSFQGRFKSGDPSYLSVVIPGDDYATAISVRDDPDYPPELSVYMVKTFADGNIISEKLMTVDLEDVKTDEGSQSTSITLEGHRTTTYSAKAVSLTGSSYKSIADGKTRYRCAPDLYLRPGDTVTVNGDTFTADNISIAISVDSQTMEVTEE